MSVDEVIIREIRPQDAEQYLALCLQSDEETQFMLLEPGERVTTPEEERRRLEELVRSDHETIFVAEYAGRLVGRLEVRGGFYRRERRTAYLVIGILLEFSGRGIGTRLFQAAEDWARRRGFHRLELTVMAHNQAGIALYKKRGFEIEGTRREALLIDGRYSDEYYMAKLLD